MKRALLLIMVLVVSVSLALIGFTGCQQEEAAEEPAEEMAEEPAEEMAEEPAEEMAEEPAEEPAEEMAEEPAEEEPMDLVFGNLPTALSDEWNGYSVENFEFAADMKGVDVQVIDAAWDGAKQLNDLEDLISKGVDAISVFVWTPESAEMFAEKAAEAGIPIFFENTKLSSDLIDYEFQGDYVFNTACEYDNIGYQAIKWLDETYPGANIFYVRGMPGMGIVEAYEAGVERALAESTDGTTVAIRRDTQWDTQTAQPEVSDVLAAGEEFDAIFANNEAIAQGCLQVEDLLDSSYLTKVS